MKMAHNLALSVSILSSLAQNQKKEAEKRTFFFFFSLEHYFSDSILETKEKHVLIIFTNLSNHPGMLTYILSLERAINRVPLGMELVSLQGHPL